jgi:hypothetical protein
VYIFVIVLYKASSLSLFILLLSILSSPYVVVRIRLVLEIKQYISRNVTIVKNDDRSITIRQFLCHRMYMHVLLFNPFYAVIPLISLYHILVLNCLKLSLKMINMEMMKLKILDKADKADMDKAITIK